MKIYKRLKKKFDFIFFILTFLKFRKSYESDTSNRFKLRWKQRKPCLDDNTGNTSFDRHYIYHPAWAVRLVNKINPKEHVDISSTLHFCSVLSAFVPVRFYDYRPANLILDNLHCFKADLMKLDFESNSIPSLSCMHTVEHVGLGRYGDQIDYDGDLKAMSELSRVLAVGGSLLFVVPVGGQSIIQFNAHRVYHPSHIINEFKKLGLELEEFTLIPDKEVDGGLVTNPSEELLNQQKYGCGCFWFKKKL